MKSAAFILLVLLTSPALAESLGEETGLNAMLNRPPSGADVVLGLHQFDLFQQGVSETAGTRGNDAVKSFAEAQATAAEKRDSTLGGFKSKVGLQGAFPDQPDLAESDRLAGLQGSIGQTYISYFYRAEMAEHETAISLLKRYLEKPDNADLKTFSEKLLPMLENSFKEAANAPK